MYQTIVLGDAPKARKLAAAIKKAANARARDGWELVTFSVTNSAKAILLFRVPEHLLPEETAEVAGDAE